MQIVICYDIPDTKRRTRLRKTLKGYGQPVQYSVFECDLSPRQLQRMTQAVKAVIEPAEDNVRYYRLCRSCAEGAEFFGGKPLEEVKAAYVV
jgi:CRISPR-associated protein Cas2